MRAATAAVLAVVLAAVAPAAWADQKTIQVSATIVAKCTVGLPTAAPAATAPLQCTGSGATPDHRVRLAPPVRKTGRAAADGSGQRVVTIEF